MNTTGRRIIQKTCAIATIFTMTMADIGLVGANLINSTSIGAYLAKSNVFGSSSISYAIDAAEVNNQNIEFKAYFANNNKTLDITAAIDKQDLKIAFELGVKKDGYLSNAKLQLADNSNFKFKTDTKSDYISSIDEKSITFKQINEGESKKIEVGIEFTGLQEFDLDYLSRISTISLTGTYVNSKNSTQIKGKADLNLNWTYPENINSALTTEVLTNSVYSEDGANKKIVQALIISKIENNSYPVKDTNIEVNIPGEPETVPVHKRTTAATNGGKEFTTSNYTYENGKLNIKVQNGQDGKIVWQKNVDDEFVVNIKYPETAETTNSKITVNSSIATYNDKILTKTAEATILENKENYASIKEIETQTEIAKGKLYAGEKKDYTTKAEVNIDYAEILQKLEITEREVKALKGEEEKNLTASYKNIKFNKTNIESVLGSTWNITIKDQANNIKTITNESEPDENSNIIVHLEAGARVLKIETSKPVNNGILKYEVTKTIEKTNYTRTEIKELTQIKDSNNIVYTKNDSSTNTASSDATITLKETESKASLKIEPLTLTTSAEQEMHITAVLETDSEYRDLFKNPVIKIKLPKQINKISAKCSLLYGNNELGLKQGDFKIKQEDGQEVLIINLTGEQKTYQGDAVKGPTLNITANVGLSKLSTNSTEEVVMTYTNENAVSFADKGEQKVKVNIVSENSMILTNNIEEFNITTLGKESDKEITLSNNAEAKNATVKMQVVNNEESDISNIAILGKIATIDGKIERTSKIRTNMDNAKVYYTSVDNPTTSISKAENNWKEEATNNSKYYLIVLNSLANGSKINFSYDINIAKNLPYNLSTETFYKVSYTNNLSNTKKEAESTKLVLTTGKKVELNTNFTAKVQGTEIKQGEEIKAGEIVEYTVTVSNAGKQKLENATIKATIPESTTLIELNPKYPGVDEDSGDYTYEEPLYIEKTDRELTKSNVSINENESITLTYKVKVKENLTEIKTESAKLSVTAVGEEARIREFSNKFSPATLILNITPIGRDIVTELEKGQRCLYFAEVKNISNVEQKDIQITIKENETISIYSIESHYGDITEEIANNERTFTIKSIKPNEKAIIKIQATINEVTEKENVAQISFIATDKNNSTYRSNLLTDNVKTEKLKAEVTATTTSKDTNRFVQPGDTITYTAKVRNIGKVDAENVKIETMISDYLEIESVLLNGKQSAETEYYTEPYFEDDDEYSMVVIDDLDIKQSEEYTIQITTKVSDNLPEEAETLKLKNKVLVYGNIGLLDETNVNEYYIKMSTQEEDDYEEEDDEDEKFEIPEDSDQDLDDGDSDYGDLDGEETDDEGSENDEQDIEDAETYTITGTVWKDENNDGLRDEEEELLEGIKVYALNIETNKIATYENAEITATTGSDGTYELANLPQGNYIVTFEYDTNKYMVTSYQADEVDESINSDAVKASKIVNGQEITAAFTDNINLTEDKIDIDLGLAEAKTFSLKLEKTINKIIVTNKNGSKTYDYEDKDLAKVEIPSKELSRSNVVIEYKLKVTNVGEVAGYAKSIVDYLPASLTFNSGLNSDWYKKGNNVYTSSLSDTLIEPGETAEVILTLTKRMTESNTGLTNNKAKIESAYNSLGIPNTTIDKENEDTENVGSADAIIGVKTGTAVSYVTLTLTIIIIIGGLAYLVNKKLLLDKIEI